VPDASTGAGASSPSAEASSVAREGGATPEGGPTNETTSGPEWLRALKRPREQATVPFACDKITVRRAWHYRGEAATVPSANAELAAFHFTTQITDGVAARLVVADGNELDTDFVFVHADTSGAPIDRFYESDEAPSGPIDIVGIAAVPKGTQKLTFRARSRSLHSNDVCDTPVTLAEGTPWPPLPRYEVTRMYRTRKRSLLLLYRAKNVLPYESAAPTLIWKPSAPTKRADLAVAEIHAPLPSAIVSTDAQGEPIPYDAKATSRWVVAEYPWEGEDTPNLYTAGDRRTPLPAPAPWIVSPKLSAALDESNAVWSTLGPSTVPAFYSGGREGLAQAIADGKAFAW
jgi:hypothetical protein